MTSPTQQRDHGDHGDEVEAHDLGLSHDLPRIVERNRAALGRRGVLGIVGGLSVAAVAGCSSGRSTASTTGTATTGDRPAGGPGEPPDGGGMGGDPSVEVADGEIPEETAGPYPGDGSNGPNVLAESGVVRHDITSSFGEASAVAEGIALRVDLKVYDLDGDEATPLAGAAIYLWHCDRAGSYSMYDGDAVGENYLRGVQEADAEGRLSFTTIVPGCYAGRWPHMHFEVYGSLDAATSATDRLRTSQLALPQDVCEAVYATQGYQDSVGNLAEISLDSDGIFSDGYSLQMARVTGSVEEGYVATLNVPV